MTPIHFDSIAQELGITEKRFEALGENLQCLARLTLSQKMKTMGLSLPEIKGRFDYYKLEGGDEIEIVVSNTEHWDGFYVSAALRESLKTMGGEWSDELGTGIIFSSIEDLEEALAVTLT